MSFTPAPSIRIAGVRIDVASMRDVVAGIVDYAARGAESAYVVTPNAHHVVLHQSDERLRDVYERALYVVPDGVPLLWAARLLGKNLRGRVNGTDLFENLCAEAAARNLRVYLLGGREGAAEAAAERLRTRHPSLNVCGTDCPPMGFEKDPRVGSLVLARVVAAKPDILFVGLGAPKQEYWMHAHRAELHVPISLGIGVSFEFVGGVVKRAPRWMQAIGLEWFFRVLTEPRRLWKRYVFGNVRFCGLVLRELLQRRTVSQE